MGNEASTKTKTICKEEDCDLPFFAKGWCNRHYLRWWRTGDPQPKVTTREPLRMVRRGGWV